MSQYDGIPPAALLAAGRHEVTSYCGDIVDGTVTDLVSDGRSGFWACSQPCPR